MQSLSSTDTKSMEDKLRQLKDQQCMFRIRRQKTDNKRKVKKKLNLTGHMIKLARAKTPSQVSSIVRIARNDVRTLISQGASAHEIEAAKRIARKVSEKGDIKISKLKKEESLKRLSELQKSAKNLDKEQELTRNINRRKKNRMSQEQMDIIDAARTDYEQQKSENYMNTNTAHNALSVEISGTETIIRDGDGVVSNMESGVGGIDLLL